MPGFLLVVEAVFEMTAVVCERTLKYLSSHRNVVLLWCVMDAETADVAVVAVVEPDEVVGVAVGPVDRGLTIQQAVLNLRLPLIRFETISMTVAVDHILTEMSQVG